MLEAPKIVTSCVFGDGFDVEDDEAAVEAVGKFPGRLFLSLRFETELETTGMGGVVEFNDCFTLTRRAERAVSAS